mmetsp:Transcript_28024/g.61060  ORF Transcript_28024/g.61060 Transcript_28024/m.61060 type:complete len:180 (+) Transcript_28024:32-571(+)
MGSQRTLSWLVGLLLIGCLSRTFVERLPASRASRSARRTVTTRAVENPYDVLGLPRGTSKSDTRKSFRKIALSEHPDVNPDDPESQERFQKLVGAYNSIMGDEIFPDEVMEIRVQMTNRYQERVKSEMRDTSGLMFMGNARLIQGVITVMFFGILFALSQSDQDTVTSLLLPPSARRGF